MRKIITLSVIFCFLIFSFQSKALKIKDSYPSIKELVKLYEENSIADIFQFLTEKGYKSTFKDNGKTSPQSFWYKKDSLDFEIKTLKGDLKEISYFPNDYITTANIMGNLIDAHFKLINNGNGLLFDGEELAYDEYKKDNIYVVVCSSFNKQSHKAIYSVTFKHQKSQFN